MKWYHGSGTQIPKFDTQFLGIGVEQYGSGFYFTNSKDEAHGYAHHRIESHIEKPGGEDSPSIMTVEIDIEQDELLTGGEMINANTIQKIIEQGMERAADHDQFMDMLCNFGDISYEGLGSVINHATELYSSYEDILPTLFAMGNDLFRGEEGVFLKLVSELTGYQGVLVERDDTLPNHIVVWDPNKITVTHIESVETKDDSSLLNNKKLSF